MNIRTKAKKRREVTDGMKELFRATASPNLTDRVAAERKLVEFISAEIKKGVLDGDNTGGIFEEYMLDENAPAEYELDFITPGSEDKYVATVLPVTGRMPEFKVSGDRIYVPTIEFGASIDWSLRYAKHARWDVLGRAMQAIEAMHLKKKNMDAWHTLLAAGFARGITVTDSAATDGFFSHRLVRLMSTKMRRAAGGNATSLGRGRLSDLFYSPECQTDLFTWDLTQVPDAIRTQIFLSTDGGVTRIGDVDLHDMDELGVGQEYQNYYENTLGASMTGSKEEIVIGLDLINRDSFFCPVREDMQVFENPYWHTQRRAGMYSWEERGYTALYNARVLIGEV